MANVTTNARAGATLPYLLVILFAAAALRFYGLRHGFPFEFHVDEWFTVNKTREMYLLGSFRPPAFIYPSLVYYLLLAWAYVVGLFREPTLYDLYLAGRLISALAGTVNVFAVYRLGRRAYGEAAGLLAAALFAFTVTALRESHYYTPDPLNTLFITLAVDFCVRVALGDHARNYFFAGAAAGLAAGSKYNGAFLMLPLLLAHFLRARGQAASGESASPNRASSLKILFSKRLVAAALLSLAVFFVTTPYAVVEAGKFYTSLGQIGSSLNSRVTEGNHHYIGTVPYWYYVENLLFWSMNPVLEAACLAGFLYALARRRRPDLVIALWVVVYFAVVGGWLNKATRYTLPLLPFLCLFGARMFVEATSDLFSRGRRRAAWAVAALGLVTLASAALYSLAYVSIYARPHTGVQAARWVYANVPAGATVLLEGPTPHERPQPDGAQTIYRDASLGFDPARFRFRYLDVPRISRKDLDPSIQSEELESTLSGVDYVVMSTRWYEGLVSSPEASPVIRDYYGALAGGAGEFELVEEITSYPSLFGVEIRDDRAELNFRIFDHPKVWVFRRKAGAPLSGSTGR